MGFVHCFDDSAQPVRLLLGRSSFRQTWTETKQCARDRRESMCDAHAAPSRWHPANLSSHAHYCQRCRQPRRGARSADVPSSDARLRHPFGLCAERAHRQQMPHPAKAVPPAPRQVGAQSCVPSGCFLVDAYCRLRTWQEVTRSVSGAKGGNKATTKKGARRLPRVIAQHLGPDTTCVESREAHAL